MAPIRVLHCVAGLGHGGYESLLMNLYRHIDTNVVQFDFVSSFPGVYEAPILAQGGVIHHVPFITQKGPFVYAHQLDKLFQTHPEYHIVHSHMDKFSGLVMKRAKAAGVPARIAHSHNTQNEGGLAFQLVKDHYGRMVLPNATHLFACSDAAAAWMFGEKAPEATVLKNGIDPALFAANPAARQAVRAEHNLADDCLVFGHVGRFTAQKNHPRILDIFAQIAKTQPNSALLLVGTGTLMDEMQQKAAALNLADKTHFLGARQDVPDVLQGIDCMLFPSLHEGLPVTLVEAQAAGLPVVASDAITTEVCVTPLVQLLSLEQENAVWAGAALAAATNAQTERTQPLQALADAGYDIRQTAKQLQEFYCSLQNG